MLDQVFQFISIIRYIIIGIGVLGIIILIMGLYRGDNKLKMRGAYFFVLSVVLAVCGYLIYNATVDRATQIMQESTMMY